MCDVEEKYRDREDIGTHVPEYLIGSLKEELSHHQAESWGPTSGLPSHLQTSPESELLALEFFQREKLTLQIWMPADWHTLTAMTGRKPGSPLRSASASTLLFDSTSSLYTSYHDGSLA